MSKEGSYLGGIRTIEDLRARCTVDEDTKCWHWNLAFSCCGPKVHFVTPDTGKRVSMRGRRAALYLATGNDLPAGHVAFARYKCKSEDCVNPQHTRGGTRPEFGAYLVRSGRAKTIAKALAGSRVARQYRAVLTIEIAREVRASDESPQVLAARYGVASSVIRNIRTGVAWKETMGPASVFSSRIKIAMPQPDQPAPEPYRERRRRPCPNAPSGETWPLTVVPRPVPVVLDWKAQE